MPKVKYFFIDIDLNIDGSELKTLLESKNITQNYDVCEYDWLEDGYHFERKGLFVFDNEYYDLTDDTKEYLEDYFCINENVDDVPVIKLSEL